MILNSSKLENQIRDLRSELAALRSALEAESARSDALELALRESHEAVEALRLSCAELRDRLGQAGDAAAWRERIEDLERRTISRDHLLKLEKRLDQQADDSAKALAGLVIRLEQLKRSGTSS